MMRHPALNIKIAMRDIIEYESSYFTVQRWTSGTLGPKMVFGYPFSEWVAEDEEELVDMIEHGWGE